MPWRCWSLRRLRRRRICRSKKRAKRDKEHQAERAKLEQQKRVEKEMRLATERPITEHLKSLGFTSSLSAEVTAGELQVFAKANKAGLRTMGVDMTKLARKDLIVHKLGSAQPGLQWVRAAARAHATARTNLLLPSLLCSPGRLSPRNRRTRRRRRCGRRTRVRSCPST